MGAISLSILIIMSSLIFMIIYGKGKYIVLIMMVSSDACSNCTYFIKIIVD